MDLMNGSTQLELGAGDRPTPGFVHNDARDLPDIEIICPAEEIDKVIPPGSLTLLRATHLLEHFSHRETVPLLTLWGSLLRPDGMIYLEVPNFMAQARALVNGHPEYTEEQVVVLAYGEQDYEGNAHKTGFTEDTLRASLERAGFVNIHILDIGMVLIAQARKA